MVVVKARPVVHGRSHGIGGSDPVPRFRFGYGFSATVSGVTSGATEQVTGFFSGGGVYPDDPGPVNDITLSRPGTYLVLAECLTDARVDNTRITTRMLVYDGVTFVSAWDPLVATRSRHKYSSTQDRFSSGALFFLPAVTLNDGQVTMRAYVRNGDTIDRDFGSITVCVLQLPLRSYGQVDGRGWD